MYFFFDIDRVLINTEKEIEDNNRLVGELASKEGLDPMTGAQVFDELMVESKTVCGFTDIDWASKQFEKHFGKQGLGEKLAGVLLRKRKPNILFSDTLVSLRMFRRLGQIAIFSEGHKEFQLAKLTADNLINLFEPAHIYIFPDKSKRWYVFPKKEEVYFFDDKREILLQARMVCPWLKTLRVGYSEGKSLEYFYRLLFNDSPT